MSLRGVSSRHVGGRELDKPGEGETVAFAKTETLEPVMNLFQHTAYSIQLLAVGSGVAGGGGWEGGCSTDSSEPRRSTMSFLYQTKLAYMLFVLETLTFPEKEDQRSLSPQIQSHPPIGPQDGIPRHGNVMRGRLSFFLSFFFFFCLGFDSSLTWTRLSLFLICRAPRGGVAPPSPTPPRSGEFRCVCRSLECGVFADVRVANTILRDRERLHILEVIETRLFENKMHTVQLSDLDCRGEKRSKA